MEQAILRSGGYSAAGNYSAVVDHSGNIYVHDDGFDSIDHVFTGIVPAGITKLNPNGSVLWHKTYKCSTATGTKAAMQIDQSDNVYMVFSIYNIFSPPATITLGTVSIPVPVIHAGSFKGCLAAGSLTPDGNVRWLRAFEYTGTSLAAPWQTTGTTLIGNRLFIEGYDSKANLYFDNGLTLFNDRNSQWLVSLNSETGESIWGVAHKTFYTCPGISCPLAPAALASSAGYNNVMMIGFLQGAFVFKPTDTVSSQVISVFAADTSKPYFAVYDSLGTPIKAKTYRYPNASFSNLITAARNGNYFTFYGDTLVKVDTGFNIKWKYKTGIFPMEILGSTNTNDLFITYTNGYNEFLRKMVDSAAVISGKTYADWDNNGIFNPGDSALANILVTTNNTLLNSISSNDSGKFKLYVAPGSYTLHANFSHPYYQFLPATQTATINSFSDTVGGKDFRLRPLFSFTDVSVSFSDLGVARPGRPASYMVTVKNFGATPTPIDVGLKLPPLTSYAAISGATVTVNAADSITISMGSVNPFATQKAYLTLNIATTATIADTLRYYPKAYPYAADTVKEDNIDTLVQNIRTSFDPNEKEVDLTRQPLSDTGRSLVYTIRFQNTGNDTAFYVRLTDTLPPTLDANTFNFIDASHQVTTEIKNNVLHFIFNPVILPDSTHNELESHGFVKFKITPKSPFNITDTIFNKAAIYFDYNTPVITNDAKSWYYAEPVLPVILRSFVAEKKNSSVLLKFVTASEPDLNYFIIERSADGTNFTSIGTITPKGSTSTGSSYLFEDLSPGKEVNFYRLKMVDKDLKITYSWIVIIKFSDTELQHIAVFPNPANDNLYISFRNMNTQKPISCRLIDATGRTVWVTNINTNLRDTYSINTSSLPNGIYFITAANNTTDFHQEVIIRH